ncbi:phosphate ABC transporter permease subunit PstC [Methylosinus sp. KRF6]|uniref:phosphate ABC transporter permease subunit PstC n=1 Tax=Methylosinus sp. KRF6 TaxID=2846853 RepID=UPI001C0C77CD|nr:phosphate ABC transporter permease subunit PstC [Methylosinus sp. KRF6]MBU3889299.1 phosphate ABC transporter permease subunit PstC [Methylosinus sp. KRF6]
MTADLFRLEPIRGRFGDRAAQLFCYAALALVIVFLAALLLLILSEALPALSDPRALFGDWAPAADPPRFGFAHAMISTLMATALALLLAVPIGFGIGLFAAEIAPLWMRGLLRPGLELLAGVPSVVYGFLGYVTLVQWLERHGGMATGESLLVAALVLAVMTLPFLAGASAEAFAAVPRALVEAAYAAGVTRFHVARRILAPAALPGLFAAVALGLARAIGETLAVLLLAGNSTSTPTSYLDRGQPLTALIATELPEAGVGSGKYHALYAAGLALLLVAVATNMLIWRLKARALSHDR